MAELVRITSDRHLLMIAVHHIVADGWSVGVIEEDIGALYGTEPRVVSVRRGASYTDHVVQQADSLAALQTTQGVEHWREVLGGAPTVLSIPARATTATRSFRGTSSRFALGKQTTKALQRLADDFQVTPFVASSMVFGITLMDLAGVDDVLFGTPVAGRYDRALERTVGMFANTIVMRLDARGDPPITELMSRYRRFVDAAYAYQHVPLDEVVEAIAPVRSTSHTTLVQALFSYDYGFGEGLTTSGLTVREVEYSGATSKFDLAGTVGRDPRDFGYLTVEYSTDLFTVGDIRHFAETFEAIATSVAHQQGLTAHEHLEKPREFMEEVP